MIRINGEGVSGGTAIGKIVFLKKDKPNIEKRKVRDTAAEIMRYRKAANLAKSELDNLYKTALEKSGAETAEIFEIHKMMLDDRDFIDDTEREITDRKCCAEWAVSETSARLAKRFSEMDSEYMCARAADIKDISDRLISILTNGKGSYDGLSADGKLIVCADELTPSETVRLDRERVVAFATRFGSAQSHTAILARAMDIPAIITLGNALSDAYDKMDAIANGDEGCLYIEPTAEVTERERYKIDKERRHRERLHRLVGMENIKLDGHRVMLYANIGSPDDAASALENDASGIGLFRSEFLYMESSGYPSEEKQFEAYKGVLEKMGGKKVIVRTVDVGADKKIGYFGLEHEENPALGFRAIRICLCREEIFKTQIRALLRASVYGKLSVMLPMITSVDEVRESRRIINEVKTELRGANIPFDNAVELGIMIETPAAVMISDLLAREVDFFSIGTNDLTQYTLAADRQNPNIARFYDPHSTAVLRMIKQTTDNAHRARIWCGICGELAADESMTETFLAMGIDELSVSPRAILPLREKIRNTNVSAIKDDILGGF